MSQAQSKTMMTREEYVLAQDKAEFQPGQKVRVERIAESGESGWDNDWVEEMNAFVGKETTISPGFGGCPASYGIPLVSPDGSGEHFAFPYFVLVPVN